MTLVEAQAKIKENREQTDDMRRYCPPKPGFKPVSILDARNIGKRYALDRLVIVAVNNDGRSAITTYGKDKATCDALAEWAESDDGTDLLLAVHRAGQ